MENKAVSFEVAEMNIQVDKELAEDKRYALEDLKKVRNVNGFKTFEITLRDVQPRSDRHFHISGSLEFHTTQKDIIAHKIFKPLLDQGFKEYKKQLIEYVGIEESAVEDGLIK